MINIFMIIVAASYLICNIIWHKKIIDSKWKYTIYSTIILISYIIFALLTLSLT